MNNPPAHRLYEVRVFHSMGDFLEWHLVKEPFFAGTRLSEDCTECRNDAGVLPPHDHFLIIVTVQSEIPFNNNHITDLEGLVKRRLFYENERPPPPRARFISWAHYLFEVRDEKLFEGEKRPKVLPSERELLWKYLQTAPATLTWLELTDSEMLATSLGVCALSRLFKLLKAYQIDVTFAK